MGTTVAVVVPCNNEAETIESLVRGLVRSFARFPAFRLTVVVVDDGSTDATPSVLDRIAAELAVLTIVRNPGREGKSRALLRGIGATHAQWIATIDADGQDDPVDVPGLLVTLLMVDRR